MPNNFAATAPGGRPATTRSTTIPGAGNPGEDDLLKARLSALNTDPFTAEHLAAYAAFAGVSDRKTALDLHRNGVTWDDVNDYDGGEDFDASNYTAMKALKRAGVTPGDWQAWVSMAARHTKNMTHPDAVVFASNNITPEQVEPFYAETNPTLRWSAPYLVGYINAGVSPATVIAYAHNAITDTANIARLTKARCLPETIAAYRAAGGEARTFRFEHDFIRYFDALVRAVSRPPLVRVAVANNASVVEAAAWSETNESLLRIDLYLKARIRADEWYGDPTVAEATNDTLAMLAALHGHAGIRAA